MEFTPPRCASYSCTSLPEFVSHCHTHEVQQSQYLAHTVRDCDCDASTDTPASTHLDDLLVGASCDEEVLLVWMELRTVRDLLVAECAEALASLCVPQLGIPIVTHAHEPPVHAHENEKRVHQMPEGCSVTNIANTLSVVGELDVPNSTSVTHIGAQTFSIVVTIPYLQIKE